MERVTTGAESKPTCRPHKNWPNGTRGSTGPKFTKSGHPTTQHAKWLQPGSSFSCLPFLFALQARALQIFKLFNLALISNVPPRCRPSAQPFRSWQCRMVRVVTVCTVTACARARYGAHLEPGGELDSRERRPRVWSPPPVPRVALCVVRPVTALAMGAGPCIVASFIPFYGCLGHGPTEGAIVPPTHPPPTPFSHALPAPLRLRCECGPHR